MGELANSSKITLVCVDQEHNTWMKDRQPCDPWQHGEGRIWQIGVVVMQFAMDDKKPAIVKTYDSMVKPDDTWPEFNVDNGDLKFAKKALQHKFPNPDPQEIWNEEGQPMEDVLAEVTKIFREFFTEDCHNVYLVSHNLACERKYLLNEYSLHANGDFDFVEKIFKNYGLCTMVPQDYANFMFRKDIPVDIKYRNTKETKCRRLNDLYRENNCSLMGPVSSVNFHDALADSKACGEIAFKLITTNKYPDLPQPSLKRKADDEEEKTAKKLKTDDEATVASTA